jgi:pyruvate decarboxylase
LDCTIFLIENDGYEIERWVHGMKAKYNDISKWRYSKIAEVFTPEEEVSQHRVKSYKVSTRSELEELLADEEFSEGKGLHVSPKSHCCRQRKTNDLTVRGVAYAKT